MSAPTIERSDARVLAICRWGIALTAYGFWVAMLIIAAAQVPRSDLYPFLVSACIPGALFSGAALYAWRDMRTR